jgi:hypothetical protein
MPHPPSATASDVLPTRRHTTRHPQPRNQLQPLLDYTLFASASLRSEHVSSPTISELAAHRSRLARNVSSGLFAFVFVTDCIHHFDMPLAPRSVQSPTRPSLCPLLLISEKFLSTANGELPTPCLAAYTKLI